MDVVGWNDSPGMRPNVGAAGVERCAVKWHVRCDQRIIPSLPIAGSGRSPRSKEMQSFLVWTPAATGVLASSG